MSEPKSTRRTLFQLAGAGLVSVGGLASNTAGATSDPDASLVFEEQTSDGTSITIAEASSTVDGMLAARSNETGALGRTTIEAGTTIEDLTLEFSEPIGDDREIEIAVSIYDGETGQGIAREVATVSFEDTVDVVSGVEERFVEADPSAGFNYPYYLYAPDRVSDDEGTPVLVEPNNTGTTADDLEEHREVAQRHIEGGTSRRVSEEIGTPLVIPVFPRPAQEPVDWSHYIHALDRETMGIESGDLERVDRQLLAMVEHARGQLESEGYDTDDGVMLNGFSASGNFVERFAMLHPEKVVSVTAGGLNGMVTLPHEEYDGHELPFHVGIADVEELTGEPVDLDAVDEVNHFLYMGAQDDNDTIPFDDAWTEDELRQTALDVYGDDMIAERFPTCQKAFEDADVSAQFKIYEDAGHSPREAEDDLIEFHRKSLAGESVSEFGEALGTEPVIEVSTTEPAVDEDVSFDATESSAGIGAIVAYTWEFGDGETASGETVTHAFSEVGTQTVTLTVVDDNGVSTETTVDVVVGDEVESGDDDDTDSAETDDEDDGDDGADGTDDEDESGEAESESEDPDNGAEDEDTTEDDESDASTTDDSAADTDGTPGPGIVGTLASIGGAGYLLTRRHGDGDDTQT
ncbi:PKD domain-containing protein [Natrialba sp. SSL1]|uniref:PKD domain-containing protein n=1 Tax=Natrialba sp. SSL1 TaxID=1869245 RepID=UPI00149552A6|nr:PKD domain-containing protein [Natrialba sp. SSL1]